MKEVVTKMDSASDVVATLRRLADEIESKETDCQTVVLTMIDSLDRVQIRSIGLYNGFFYTLGVLDRSKWALNKMCWSE